MPQTVKKLLFDSTLVAASPNLAPGRPDVASVADCRGYTVRAVEVIVSGGSGSPTFNVEANPGAVDQGVPNTPWFPVAVRPPGGGAYSAAAATLATAAAPGSAQTYHMDPADYFPWIRLNVLTNVGAARVQAWVEMEV